MGSLEDLEFGAGPSPSDPITGQISLVLGGDQNEGSLRKVPCLYIGNAPVFGDRHAGVVVGKLGEVVDLMNEAGGSALYAMTACQLDGEFGLYTRDFFNRSSYRRQLRQAGMIISERPWVTFGQARFTSNELGEFEPRFVVMQPREEHRDPIPVGGAWVPFVLGSYRIGRLAGEELAQLSKLGSQIHAIAGGTALEAIESLRAGFRASSERDN